MKLHSTRISLSLLLASYHPLVYALCSVEANECSGLMLAASSALLNHILPYPAAHSSAERNDETLSEEYSSSDLEFYPQLYYSLMDDWDFDARLEGHTIDNSDTEHIRKWLRSPPQYVDTHSDVQEAPAAGRLVFQAGEFQSVYSGDAHRARVDVVITCFFIDTASESVLVYLRVIQHVLRPGGLWINAGPLHYHRATSTPYSHSYLQRIIAAAGFDLLESRVVEADYCGEAQAMMKPEFYRVPISVYRKQTEIPSSGDFLGEEESSFMSFPNVASLTEQLKALADDWADQNSHKRDEIFIVHEP